MKLKKHKTIFEIPMKDFKDKLGFENQDRITRIEKVGYIILVEVEENVERQL